MPRAWLALWLSGWLQTELTARHKHFLALTALAIISTRLIVAHIPSRWLPAPVPLSSAQPQPLLTTVICSSGCTIFTAAAAAAAAAASWDISLIYARKFLDRADYSRMPKQFASWLLMIECHVVQCWSTACLAGWMAEWLVGWLPLTAAHYKLFQVMTRIFSATFSALNCIRQTFSFAPTKLHSNPTHSKP